MYIKTRLHILCCLVLIYIVHKKKTSLFTKKQSFRLFQSQSICRQQNKSNSNMVICLQNGRKYFRKRRKCWLPVSLFPTMFSKGFSYRVIKSHDCVVKSYFYQTVCHLFQQYFIYYNRYLGK